MKYKPQHNPINPFPAFSPEELNFYMNRGRVLRSRFYLEIPRSFTQWVMSQKARLTGPLMRAIPRISPGNLQETRGGNQ